MNALELAIQRKENAIAQYRNTLEDCGHPSGKKMFQAVLNDEESHLSSLKALLEDLDTEQLGLGEVDNLATIIQKMQSHTGANPAFCSLDEMEPFKVAMEMEKEDYEFYKELAAMSEVAEEKALFEKLAQEEETHFEVLSETHSFLADSGNWFMWEDHSIVEG